MRTAEQILEEKGGEMIWVAADSTVEEALKIMVEKNIGAILVKEGEEIVGIWTEHELLSDILTEGFDPKTARIRDFMTTDLQSAPHNATVYQLMDKFLGMRLRHLLIIKEGKYIGLISSGDVTKASLTEKTAELEKLNAMVSWEYYEDWRWKSKD
jgi:signal-transduction protein with cAMP-binding, CBS, and nucleotidyltransferase domain